MRVDAALKAARMAGVHALDARLLLEEVTGLSTAETVASPDYHITSAQIACFNSYITRRTAHEPVSRIVGWREFYGRRFKVTPDVLDPRPDTECVVDLALKLVSAGRFVDLGAGSGILAATLCAENLGFSGVATDVSQAALDVARSNAFVLGVAERIEFHCGSWFDGLEGQFDLIISNPPYICESEALPPEVAGHDPHLSLFGGDDGLSAYRAIAAGADRHLAQGGRIIAECGAGQDIEIELIFRESGFVKMASARDLGGHLRVLAFGRR